MCNVHLARFCGYPGRCWPLHHLSAKLALDEIVCHITVLTISDKTQIGQLAHHWIRNVPSYPLVFVAKLYHTQEQGYINQVEHSGRQTGDNTEFSFSVLAAAVTRILAGRTAVRQPACRMPMARPAFPTHRLFHRLLQRRMHQRIRNCVNYCTQLTKLKFDARLLVEKILDFKVDRCPKF